ncbi:N-acetylglucosamine-6-phosphate deacetylase [Domibacillus antri]|uniref:N-acetylglucosamine-6-phosphate deacetylase n=1 Tax=Domibacillus antri TaxID=1714264 RepID=A0A1Q8Q3L5_9BACI|nr:N-acetylglucosamine-6-phosphate deacetylase [Domibacillus antri]OLN21917.1 N-acetylglucosamine-6-phosphate deacetylase [Domibacillus antri]
MNENIIQGGSVFAEQNVYSPGFVHIKGGKIAALGPISECPISENIPSITVPESYSILPGAVDIHIHGAAGADTMDASEESLSKIASFLPGEGTTTFLATTMTQSKEKIEHALQAASSFTSRPDQAFMAGVHLEGPFISRKHPGAQPANAIIKPDISLFKHWNELSGERIRLVTLAPEEDNSFELIAYLHKQRITASAGHTDAVYEQLKQAEQTGLTHITHLYNGMRGMHHREPGTAGGAFLLDSLYIEMIADGIHVHPAMVRLAYCQKTAERTILITDSMRAKGLPDGIYDLGGQAVSVVGGKAMLEDGTLAGSTLSMQEAIRNMMTYTGCGVREIVKMTAENPAKQAGLFDRVGSIKTGKDADIVIYDDHMKVHMTICRGVKAYGKELKK